MENTNEVGNGIRLSEIRKLSNVYKLFDDETRVKILCLLSEKSYGVRQLAEAMEMTDSAISHQLRILKTGNLVSAKRNGKEVIYSLADEHVKIIIDTGLEHIREGENI